MTADRAAASPMLTVEDLHVYYGNIAALKGISLEVHPGEIVTLIGSNRGRQVHHAAHHLGAAAVAAGRGHLRGPLAQRRRWARHRRAGDQPVA
jgi:ABC-type branched-subunit amino acid transport system ATPase component